MSSGCIPIVHIPVIEGSENERLQDLGRKINTAEAEFREHRDKLERFKTMYLQSLHNLNTEFNTRAQSLSSSYDLPALVKWMVFHSTLQRYSYSHLELKLYKTMYSQYLDCLSTYLEVIELLSLKLKYSSEIESKYSSEIEYFNFKRTAFAHKVDDYFSKKCIGRDSISGWDLIGCNPDMYHFDEHFDGHQNAHRNDASDEDQYVSNYHYAESTVVSVHSEDLFPATNLDSTSDHSCDRTLSSHMPFEQEVIIDNHLQRYFDACVQARICQSDFTNDILIPQKPIIWPSLFQYPH
jgi:hypothetical protein